MKKLFLSLSLFLGTILCLAQVIPPPPPQPEAADTGGPATPIDNNIYLLVVISLFLIAYTYKKLKINKI